jgi:hypothetical protein
MLTPNAALTVIDSDQDAVEIGRLYREADRLYREAEQSLIESVRRQLECGRMLQAKKEALGHGNWLPWLEANVDVLGFGERAAQKLMKAAKANPNLDADLSAKEALQISRQIWDHTEPPEGNPEDPPPRPTLRSHYAVLADAIIQTEGADALKNHINAKTNAFEEASRVSRAQFEQAARAVEHELAGR